jgi:hypothetical protein
LSLNQTAEALSAAKSAVALDPHSAAAQELLRAALAAAQK